MGLGQIANLRGCLARNRGVVFLRRVWYLDVHYVLNLVFLLILPSQTYPDAVKVWTHWYMYTLYRSPADHRPDHTSPYYCRAKRIVCITPWWDFVFDLGVSSNKGKVSTPGKSGNLWSNGLVVKDSQSMGPVFKTTGWLQGRLGLSSFRGRKCEYLNFWGLSGKK